MAGPAVAAQLGLPVWRGAHTRERWLLERGPAGWQAVGYQGEALARWRNWGWG
jgi:hypothetical protein